ncbi:C40 family peptidase [Roseisolibacter sp. H3M3-2]|uniref:C40 family peptidase n=1 Tax=Roseisolibacter sp. H3M3-2 TaxID=3031323 RepID=UPI0023DA9B09|nr:C40 family peptidase [Roseisolibacter sp. H3M3-2]MDF1502364.1 C40 family peptidase [Roseisolibacter sp. H3M3-2]
MSARTPSMRAAVLACALAAAGCTTTVARVPIRIPIPVPEPRRAPDPPARVLRTADDYLGVRYKWGGTSPSTGFDCSGYVQYVYGKEGVRLPRTSRQQAVAGTRRPTRWDAASPGDLVMFANPGEAVSHVAFYAGDGRILHSSSSGGGVRYDDLGTQRGRWYRERLVAVRRVSDRGPAIARGLLESLGLAEVRLDPPDRAPRP